MKTFVLKILIFIFFTCLFYFINLIFFGDFINTSFKSNLIYFLGGYGHTHSRLAEVKTYKDVDILFLGSSHAYRGFDTRIFSKHRC